MLVATDIASKGLDFENIQHVINYDMPGDIENYGKCVRMSVSLSCFVYIHECLCLCVCAHVCVRVFFCLFVCSTDVQMCAVHVYKWMAQCLIQTFIHYI